MLIKIAKVDYIIDEGFIDRLQYLQRLVLLMEENFSDLVIIKVKEDLNPKRSSSDKKALQDYFVNSDIFFLNNTSKTDYRCCL